MSVEQERGQALMQIVTDIAEELNTMIADETLDFDIFSAASIAAHLHSVTVNSVPLPVEGKLEMTLNWLELHLDTVINEIGPESMRSLAEMLQQWLLDVSVDEETVN